MGVWLHSCVCVHASDSCEDHRVREGTVSGKLPFEGSRPAIQTHLTGSRRPRDRQVLGALEQPGQGQSLGLWREAGPPGGQAYLSGQPRLR